MDNLYRNLPEDLADESFDALVDSDNVLIERIVSQGHSGPDDGWYDQHRAEWVLLLRGAARLTFEDGREVSLRPGDWLDIPAHCRHRVAWTDPDRPTIWLAVHYKP